MREIPELAILPRMLSESIEDRLSSCPTASHREVKAMLKRTFQLLLVASLVTATLQAATDPFVGDWKLNPSKSKLVDNMKVESLGGNRYEFDLGGGPERIEADGTDQAGAFGTMLSVTVEGPDSWKVVRKKDGRTLLTGNWKLSQDGNTLTDNYTEFDPKGLPSTTNYVFTRTTGGLGFAGTWESTMPMTSSFVLQVRPYEGNGLSFIRSPQDTRNLKLDGKDYPVEGRGVPQGSTSSARRVDERTLEITDKVNGKVTRTERRELSPDLKTLTRTVRPVGQREPAIFVFERQ